MAMIVHQFVNPYRLANTYLLELKDDEVLLIDVGNIETAKILDWIHHHKKKLTTVVLTHEHSDHCAGVNKLYSFNSFQLLCSRACSKNIANKKQNFSLYLDDLETFEIRLPTTTVEDGQQICMGGYDFTFMSTPGHSPGSICISVNNCMFTGDSILPDNKTPLNFPHSSRADYLTSLEKLSFCFNKNMRIYPGHGNPFKFISMESLYV